MSNTGHGLQAGPERPKEVEEAPEIQETPRSDPGVKFIDGIADNEKPQQEAP